MARRFTHLVLLTLAVVALTGCPKKTPAPPPDNGGDTGDGSDAATDKPIDAEPGDLSSGNQLSRIHFDYDQAILTSGATSALAANAAILKANPTLQVRIEGHCDERGETTYNLALGDRRASAVKAYLTNLGIDGKRITTVSMGEEKPLVAASTEDAYAKNRRAETIIASGGDGTIKSSTD